MKRIFFLTGILFIVNFALAQTPSKETRKTVKAVRVNGEITVDGRLTEEVWQSRGYSAFTQVDPVDGAQPTEKTRVWIAYDDNALYVGAYLYDSEPGKIANRLYRRDQSTECDWFAFHIDPYHDRLSGYMFAVNPAGSIADATLSNDVNSDFTWDGIWEWAARIENDGWIVELMVPFNQLRFPEKDEYIMGVNFARVIFRKNEQIVFSWRPKEESGSVSHFADLTGIRGISPGKYIEFIPYTVGQSEFSPKEDGNPFMTGKDYFGNAGFDLKVGLKSNLILDATFNPDFGQVELDPAVINLTAYETYYEEKRPFFIEGSRIFNFGTGGVHNGFGFDWAQPNFFYSRRIGRAPAGSVSEDGYVDYPDRTTILGAAKITGKIGNGWNVGIVNALTSREDAQIDNNGNRMQKEVEPLSNYGVIRLQKEFNEGRQGFGFIGTAVNRNFQNEALKEVTARGAYTFGFDGWTFLDKDRDWAVNGWLGTTSVTGSESYIHDLQKSSIHYFQRPDADHVKIDENATAMSGWGGRFLLAKQQGNVIVNAGLGMLSPGFDIGNLGYQHGSADKINAHFATGYVWYHPGKIFRNNVILFATHRNYDFGGTRFGEGYYFINNAQFLNYWNYEILVGKYAESLDNGFTRGGPLALALPFWFTRASISSDNRKKIVLGLNTEIFTFSSGSSMRNAGFSATWKPRTNIDFTLAPHYNRHYFVAQYITAVDDPLMTDTYGKRYVYEEIDQHMFSMTFRLNWTFTPKLTLQAYMQPFVAVGDYHNFKEFAKPRTFDFNNYGEGLSTVEYNDGDYTIDPDGKRPAESFTFSDPDFNVKSLRGTIVLRWEYYPGSRLYVVWTQNRADYENPGDFSFRRDFTDMWKAEGTNIFLIKISHRLKF